MEQIELYHNETPCTSKQSKVFVEDDKVYQHTSNFSSLSVFLHILFLFLNDIQATCIPNSTHVLFLVLNRI